MATNKHAIIRYQALDKCFRNPGRKYFINDLVDACNEALFDYSGGDVSVEKRQVYDDINFMKSDQGWNIPVVKINEGRKVYYRYDDIGFSINNQPLNEREEIQLREALLTLSRFKGMPQFMWMDELTAKLEQGLGLSKVLTPIMEFEQNQYLEGLDHITPIYEAIQNKKTLSVEYKSFSKDRSEEIVLSPYYLKQFNNRWFLFGTVEGYKNLTNLALDRIICVRQSDSEYQLNTDIDFSEYFEDVIGVSVDPRIAPQKIQIQIDKNLFPYIKTKPIHGSQKYIGEKDGCEIIQLELIPNYELESLLLGFGEKIEVLAPKELREKIKIRLKKSVNKYN